MRSAYDAGYGGGVDMAGLSLPADLEKYVSNYNQLHSPGAYALRLSRPDDLADAWQRHYDERPDYWPELRDAETVYYVGGTSDLLNRLEDHRNGSVRSTVLTEVCEIEGLQVAWTTDDAEKAREILEPRLARWLGDVRDDAYVHQR